MKKVYIEAFDCCFFIYKKDEAKKFEKVTGESVGDAYGQVCGNCVWIGEYKDIIGLCYHEASHIVDWILESRLCIKQGDLGSNMELRAYLLEYVGKKIREYCVEAI